MLTISDEINQHALVFHGTPLSMRFRLVPFRQRWVETVGSVTECADSTVWVVCSLSQQLLHLQ